MSQDSVSNKFSSQYIDLLNEKVGGRALACSDEWFAECSNLVKADEPVFKEGHFIATGQWMDGWESRRSYGRAAHRSGQRDIDWCVLRLGIPGEIRGVDVNTMHFRGNAPEFASIEGAWEEGAVSESTEWFELLPKTPTEAHSHNIFNVKSDKPCTHLRLNMHPDGGVARLRAYGEAQVISDNFIEGELVDLASVRNGGRGVACSDMFYSSPSNLLMPKPGINMGDGWETKRRRNEDNDWSIIKLGLSGSIRKVIVDTAHFKGNFPDRFSLEATRTEKQDPTAADIEWEIVIPETPLFADQEHLFIKQIVVSPDVEFTHVRMNIYPDGGISRLRVFGFPNWKA
ncbi:MAG: allantoicase [Pseudomonadales bacterium]